MYQLRCVRPEIIWPKAGELVITADEYSKRTVYKANSVPAEVGFRISSRYIATFPMTAFLSEKNVRVL